MRPFGCFKPSIIKELRPVAPLDSWEKEKSSGPLRAASIDVLRFFPERFRASPLDTLDGPRSKLDPSCRRRPRGHSLDHLHCQRPHWPCVDVAPNAARKIA